MKLKAPLVNLPLITFAVLCFFALPQAYAGHGISSCGGDGERACCAGTFEVLLGDACDSGNVEVAGCDDDCLCGGWNPFGIEASGTCTALDSCGGEGERACCDGLSEGQACEDGLIKIEGCSGNCLCGGSGTGQVSVHTCVRPTPCGGEGQRACCSVPLEPRRVELGRGCEDGLVGIEGCTGDCACGDGINTVGTSTHTCVAADWEETLIEEPETQWTAPTQPRECPLQGYADLHIHLNADLAHGGNVFAGKPAPTDGVGEFMLIDNLFDINTALSHEDDDALHSYQALVPPGTVTKFRHGVLGDTIGDGTKDGATGFTGAPAFNSWPTWTTTTHQQMYYKWLERAYLGGLRLAVMLAVTNEALCKSTEGFDCANSMGPIDDQLDAAYDFEGFIDSLHGGAGLGWFRIVTTPAQARQVIAEDKLAVVLGIEVDNLFNCKEQNDERPDASCPNMRDENGDLITNAAGEPIDTIEKAVAHYYDKGVRHVFPVHNFDNAFGAAATWQDVIGIGNAYSEQRWWEVEDCGTGNGDYGFWLDNALFPLIALIGFDGEVPPVPAYTNGNLSSNFASCNKYGLNLSEDSPGPDKRGLGAELINQLIAKGIIIDIDHMSRKSLDQTIELTKQTSPQYPLVATHVQFHDLHEMEFEDNAGRHERMRTLAQLEAIKESGGMIAAMTKDDVQDTGKKGKKFTTSYEPAIGAKLPDDCRHSSNTFAQALQYAMDTMRRPVALGSDFNGIAGHVGPRFGSDACGGGIPFSEEIGAANERSAQIRADRRLEYPFTLPGFGTFDKQVTGLKTFDFNVDGLAHVGLVPDLIKDMQTIGLSQKYIDALFNSAEEYIRVWERAKAISEGTAVPILDPSQSCPASVFDALACIGAPSVGPEIACPADLELECTGPLTAVAFDPAATTSTNSCGSATFQGCTPASGSAFDIGIASVTCAAIDGAKNVGSCNFNVTVEDTTPPQISCPAHIVAECAASKEAVVTPGMAIGSDICSTTVSLTEYETQTFSLGTTTLAYEAIDEQGLSSGCVSDITVVDTTPPVIDSVGVTPDTLWPPNHKMQSVSVQVVATDACDSGLAPPSCAITGITSNEQVNGSGDSDTQPDWQITGVLTAELRRERSGSGTGRNYTLEITCTDQQGLSTMATTVVTVPHDQRAATPSDGGNPKPNEKATKG